MAASVALKLGDSDAELLATIAASPESAKKKDEHGRLPLHCAASGASEAVVAALLQAHPEAAKEKDENGRLPLQCAFYETGWIMATEVEGESKEVGAKVIYQGREMVVSTGVSRNGDLLLKSAAKEVVILALLLANPEAAKEKDENGTMLHYGVLTGASEAVVLALLQAYPEAAKANDRTLHCAVEMGASEALVAALLQASPEAAKEKGKSGKLPLHCIGKSTSEGVVAALLQAHPEAAKEKTEYDFALPLHCAVEMGASEAAVEALLQAYPEAVKEKGRWARLPLHYAVSNGASKASLCNGALLHCGRLPLHYDGSGASEAVVAALLRAYPEAVKEKDEGGRLPLHCALNNGASEAVVLALLQAYPEAAKANERTLHCALKNGASEAVVAAVLQAYPEAVKEKDKDGDLPLHCAVEMGASEAAVAALRKAYEEKLPLHCAFSRGASEAAVLALLQAYPEAAKEKDEKRSLPLHLAVQEGAPRSIVVDGGSPDTEVFAYDQGPDGIPVLLHSAKLKHEDGALMTLGDAIKDGSDETFALFFKLLDVALADFDAGPEPAVFIGATGGVRKIRDSGDEGARKVDKFSHFCRHHRPNTTFRMLEDLDEVRWEWVAARALFQPTFVEAGYESGVQLLAGGGSSVQVGIRGMSTAEGGVAPVSVPLSVDEVRDAFTADADASAGDWPSLERSRQSLERVVDASWPHLRAHAPIRGGVLASFADIAKFGFSERWISVEELKPLVDKTLDELLKKKPAGHTTSPRRVRSVRLRSISAAALLRLSVLLNRPGLFHPSARLYIADAPPTPPKGTAPPKRTWHLGYAASGASEAVVLALLQVYPEAAKEKDGNGNLPLHCAVDNDTSEMVVAALLQANPEAAKEFTGFRSKLPLHSAVEKGASEAVVAALLAADMPLRLNGGTPVDHGGSWPYAVASTDKRIIAAVGRVLASKSDDPPGLGFGTLIHELVKVRDKQGRTALEASTAGPREAIYAHLLFCGRYELMIGAPEHRSATSVVLRARDLGDKTDYDQVFDDADKDGSGTLDRKELAPVAESIGLDAELFLRAEDKSIDRSSFVGICKQQLGDGQRSVVIKLMQDKEQWERERAARAENELDSRFIVQELPGVPSDKALEVAVLARGGGLGAIAQQYLPNGISLGTRAIIMDAADRNLHQIFLQERPDLNGVRTILQQVFEAVAHLHAKGLMHGDLKLLNVVRFGRDNRLRLIDLDAAAKIVPVGGEGESYTGAKFSSAVLPPELFHELKQCEAETLKIYWQGECKELQAKVAPKSFSERGVAKSSYVVKSFRVADGGEPAFDGLPYSEELVYASEKIDTWSLGALAFVLLVGEPLVPSTRDDDCVSGAAMRMLHAWGTQPGVVLERLEKIDDPAARDLVDKLLQREPSARLSVKDALEHVFFRTGRDGGDVVLQEKVVEELRKIQEEQRKQTEALQRIDANVDIIKELSTENKAEVRRTREVLLKGIFEAWEVVTPTTFIVLLKKLPEAPNEEEKAKLLEIAADGSGVTLGNDNFSVAFSGEMAVVGGRYVDTLSIGMKWLSRLKTIGSDLTAGKVGEAFRTIKAGLGDLVAGETMYLYLVDELAGEPVRAEGWPIEITTPSDVVPKLLPVMQVGLRAMSVYNGAAGVARMFGYPIPAVPEAWAAGARESVDLLKKKSSVEDYGVVQDVLDKQGVEKESGSLRGQSLRVLVDFLKEHDPGLKAGKSGHFAGLRRIGNPEDGTALWTALSDPTAINTAIKERSYQREAEELRSQVAIATVAAAAPAAAVVSTAAATASAAAGPLDGSQQAVQALPTEEQVAVAEVVEVTPRSRMLELHEEQLSELRTELDAMKKHKRSILRWRV